MMPKHKSSVKEEPDNSLKHLIKFSGLNYFTVGVKTLSAQVGVIILGTQNFEWAAFYGLSVMIANIVGGVSLAVSRALLPTASEQWAKGSKTEFRKVLNTTVRMSLLLSGFGFMIFMIEPSYVLGLLSESYVEASSALRILVVSSIISAISAIITSMLNAANRAAIVAKIGLVTSGGTIALTSILASAIGIEGAAIAMLVGSVSSSVLSVIMLKKKEKMTLSMNSVTKPFISFLVGLFVGYSLYSISTNAMISIVVAILSYAGFSLIYRVTTRTELKILFTIVRRTIRS